MRSPFNLFVSLHFVIKQSESKTPRTYPFSFPELEEALLGGYICPQSEFQII